VGLEARALDIYLELHHRKPDRPQVLLRALETCVRLRDETRLLALLGSYKGTRGVELRESACASLCGFAEDALAAGQTVRGLDLARAALRWRGDDPQGQSLVWRVAGDEVWAAAQSDVRALWTAFGADWEARYEISRESGLSPAAASARMAERLAHLAALPDTEAGFRSVRREFRDIAGHERREGRADLESLFEAVVVFGFLELFRFSRLATDAAVASLPTLLLSPRAAAWVESARALSTLAGTRHAWPHSAAFRHACGRCKATSDAFHWSCPRCGARSSLALVHPTPWLEAGSVPIGHVGDSVG
jgi:hypothetical protein